MKRFPLMVASAAIGLGLLAGIARELTAQPKNNDVPPSGGSCYYFWYNCSYSSGAYWTDCEPGGSPGMVPTSFARIICKVYVEP